MRIYIGDKVVVVVGIEIVLFFCLDKAALARPKTSINRSVETSRLGSDTEKNDRARTFPVSRVRLVKVRYSFPIVV